MKVWFDTEFIDNGVVLELISIGMVREDGRELYLENAHVNWHFASEWVLQNVRPLLTGASASPQAIAAEVQEFAGGKPEFWAYFASYDWVLLCRLYGRMLDVPATWPKWCRDLRQELEGERARVMPQQIGPAHHALADARWVRDTYLWLMERRRVRELAP